MQDTSEARPASTRSPERAGGRPQNGGPLRERPFAWILLLVLATLVSFGLDAERGFGGAFGSGFVFDDVHLIVENERLERAAGALDGFTGDYYTTGARSASGETRALGYYRPIAVLSNWLDRTIWGERAFGFHLTNVMLHLAVVLLLFALIDRLFRDRALAGSAALLFAVHPIHVESVTFISGRVDLLAALFSLVSLWLFARSLDGERSRVAPALSLLALLLALLSKEMAVTLPAAILLITWVDSRSRHTMPRALLRVLPYAAVIGAYVSIRLAALGTIASSAHADRDPGEIIRQVAIIVSSYLGLLVWPPARFNVEPLIAVPGGFDVRVLSGILLITVLAAGTIFLLLRRRLPAIALGLGWMLAAIVPVSHVLPVETMLGERYMYIPSLGACLAIVALIFHFTGRARFEGSRRHLATILLVTLAGAYAVNTVQRNAHWIDNATFWSRKSELTPSAESFTALGIEKTLVGDIEGAVDSYGRALEADPDHLEALNNYAIILLERGYAKEALGLAVRAVTVSPRFSEALNTAANAFHALGHFPQAVGQYKRALRERPDFRQAWINLGNTYFAAGLPDSAARAYDQALELAPDRELSIQAARAIALADEVPAAMEYLYRNEIVTEATSDAYLLRGSLDFFTGYREAAIASVIRATTIDPLNVPAWIELGQMYAMSARPDQARAAFQRALEIDPALSVAHNNLGVLAQETGDPEEALRRFNRALELAPDDAEVLRNLGGALVLHGNHAMAVDVLDRAVVAGRDAMALFYRGWARQEMGELTPAVNDYRSALVLDPRLADAHFRLGTLYSLSERNEESITSYESFLRWSSSDDERREAVIELLGRMREES